MPATSPDSPSRLSATTCDLCGNGPVAVVLMPGLAVCENCIRASIAASEPKKEPMTTKDPADVPPVTRFKGYRPMHISIGRTESNSEGGRYVSIEVVDPSNGFGRVLQINMEMIQFSEAITGISCTTCHGRTFDTTLLTELAQLRELAQAAVEWQRTLRLAFDEIGPGNVTLSAIAGERREILETLISAYATSQPKASK